jgi:hypothetical protein
LLANLLDAAVVAGAVWAMLSLRSHGPRLPQTLTAIWGLGAFFGALFLLLDLLRGAPVGSGGTLLDLLLLIWLHLAMGSVLRHALELPLGLGVALAVMMSILGILIVGAMVTPVAA